MRNPRFWMAAGLAAIAQVVFRHLEWLLIRALLGYQLSFMSYPYSGRKIFWLVGDACVALLITLIIATKWNSTWKSRDGFQIGAYCGLLMQVLGTAAGIVSASPMSSILYHLLFAGIAGGVEGAIIVRVLQDSEEPEENEKLEMRN
jgi:hypothetical protein